MPIKSECLKIVNLSDFAIFLPIIPQTVASVIPAMRPAAPPISDTVRWFLENYVSKK